MTIPPLLDIRGLRLSFDLYEGRSEVLTGVDLRVDAGERVGLVGESGCGKSITARAVLGLLEQRNATLTGEIRYRGANLPDLGRRAWRGVRGRKITMILQDPTAALNPLFTVGDQMVQAIMSGGRLRRRKDALARARTALARVSIDDPDRILRSYPFQLSGGLAQRVMITTALANNPDLVLADEPGSSLDVTIQKQTLHLMASLTQQSGAAILLIAHNLGMIREFCSRVYVMYAGTVVEYGHVEDVFREPLHPYTRALFAAIPRLSGDSFPKSIDGLIPDYTRAPAGCRFHPRCPSAMAACRNPPPRIEVGPGRGVACFLYANGYERPATAGSAWPAARPLQTEHRASESGTAPLIELSGLSKRYDFGQSAVHALRGVDLVVRRGECLAVVGESGSGKTTLARLLLGAEQPDAGSITFAGMTLGRDRGLQLRRRIQLVQQNPGSALNPRRSIYESVALPLAIHGLVPASRRRARVTELLELVGISADYVDRYPGSISGGQRQRVAIARALAAEPECLVLDEPTSSLDVSVQARVLELLRELRTRLGLTYIFITHDLGVVRNIADRAVVLYRGRVVELGGTTEIFGAPRHRYTQMLLSCVPVVSDDEAVHKPVWPWEHDPAAGAGPAAEGCAFAPRCPYADERCVAELPSMCSEEKGHRHACVNPG